MAAIEGEPGQGSVGEITADPRTVEVVDRRACCDEVTEAITEPVWVGSAAATVREEVAVGVPDRAPEDSANGDGHRDNRAGRRRASATRCLSFSAMSVRSDRSSRPARGHGAGPRRKDVVVLSRAAASSPSWISLAWVKEVASRCASSQCQFRRRSPRTGSGQHQIK